MAGEEEVSAVTRRSVLKGAGIAAAATAVPGSASLARGRKLVIYDSRLPESLAFARITPAWHKVDLAEANMTRFASLRAGMASGMAVEALTRRSDMVALRHELSRQGLRISGTPHYGALVRWSMKPRQQPVQR